MNLAEMVGEIAGGKLNATAFLRRCTDRIGRLESNINAFQSLDAERAKSIAMQADATAGSTRSLAPLFGVPIAVKDVFPVRGLPCEFGSPLYSGYVPDHSAKVIEKLEEAGAYVIGKTVTAEFAFLHPGKTRNPWNVEHTPGGSSSGSAAAVAAGFAPAAIGTQTNGSTIRPAAFCGIVGYKPSHDLISLNGAQPFSPTLDTAGIFTRSVVDAALIAAGVIRSLKLKELARPPRCAAVRSPVWRLAEPDQRRRLDGDVQLLREAGAEVVEKELSDSFNEAHSTLRTIMLFEGARTFGALRKNHHSGLSGTLNRALDEGEAISEPRYRAALTLRARLKKELDDLLENFDAILTPPATGEAPRGVEATGDPVFCTIWTLCGAPALTIPTGLGEQSLPLGLQIVGRYRRDADLLAVAQWCEKQLPFQQLTERES